MEIRHFISFEKVAALKSFSRAARELFLSQPTITAHISELESELKTLLFTRNTNPIELTETGKIFLNYTKQILQLIHQSTTEISNYESGIHGTLHICASESATEWLTSYLNSYKTQQPNVNIELSIYLSNISLEKVISREADIGIITQSSPIFTHKDLIGFEVSEYRGVIVFSPKHYLARYEIIPRAVFRNNKVSIPIIIFGKQTDFGVQVQKILFQKNIKFDASVDVSHSETVKSFLKKSNRVAFMPHPLVKHDLDEGSLVTRPIEDFPPIRRYGIMIYRNDIENPVLTNFIEGVLAHRGF